MSSLQSKSVIAWLELQDLIDEALYEVYGDYEMYESIRTRAVAIYDDGFHRAITLRDADGLLGEHLRNADGLSGLQAILDDAVTTIDAVGGRVGFALVYVKESGRELVFLAAINATEKGICALELKRKTGDALRDLRPVSSDADRSFVESLEWGGRRRKVKVKKRGYFRLGPAPRSVKRVGTAA
jgi:hypothetical protein